MPINLPYIVVNFYFVVCSIVKSHNIMAISCLHKNCIFDNSNFTRAHIAQLVEHFHGKEEVFSSILNVGIPNIWNSFLKVFFKLYIDFNVKYFMVHFTHDSTNKSKRKVIYVNMDSSGSCSTLVHESVISRHSFIKLKN